MADTLEINKTDSINLLGRPKKVILFNDDDHDMMQVVNQIRKATGYDPNKAMGIMHEAHEKGRAIVYTGHQERCEHIESVLCEINLGTKIEDA